MNGARTIAAVLFAREFWMKKTLRVLTKSAINTLYNASEIVLNKFRASVSLPLLTCFEMLKLFNGGLDGAMVLIAYPKEITRHFSSRPQSAF